MKNLSSRKMVTAPVSQDLFTSPRLGSSVLRLQRICLGLEELKLQRRCGNKRASCLFCFLLALLDKVVESDPEKIINLALVA